MNNRTTLLSGLAMAALAGWTTPFIMESGESAYERYEEGPVASYLDQNAEDALEIHEHRAEDWSIALYLSAIIATIAFLLNLRTGRPDFRDSSPDNNASVSRVSSEIGYLKISLPR